MQCDPTHPFWSGKQNLFLCTGLILVQTPKVPFSSVFVDDFASYCGHAPPNAQMFDGNGCKTESFFHYISDSGTWRLWRQWSCDAPYRNFMLAPLMESSINFDLKILFCEKMIVVSCKPPRGPLVWPFLLDLHVLWPCPWTGCNIWRQQREATSASSPAAAGSSHLSKRKKTHENAKKKKKKKTQKVSFACFFPSCLGRIGLRDKRNNVGNTTCKLASKSRQLSIAVEVHSCDFCDLCSQVFLVVYAHLL